MSSACDLQCYALNLSCVKSLVACINLSNVGYYSQNDNYLTAFHRTNFFWTQIELGAR